MSKVARHQIRSESSDDEPLAAKQRIWAQQEDVDDFDNDPDYCYAKDKIDSSNSNDETPAHETLRGHRSTPQISLPSTSATEPTDTTESSVFDTPKKPTRKRQGNPAKWKKTVRRSLRQTGKAYVSAKGKSVPKREVKANPCERCKFKCGEKFSEDQREQLHADYWSIEPRERKYDYICQYVEENKPERQKKTRKTTSRKYYFAHPNSHERIRV